MPTFSFKLYLSFFVGVLISALGFSYILVNNYTSKEYLKSGAIYLDGSFYKLCPSSKRCE